jgi:hypothetical protein
MLHEITWKSGIILELEAIMYLVNSKLLKSPNLIINHLKVGRLKKSFHLGPSNDATININNVLPH